MRKIGQNLRLFPDTFYPLKVEGGFMRRRYRRYKVIEKSNYDELLNYVKTKSNIKSVGILCGDMSRDYEVYVFLEDCNEVHKYKVNESNMVGLISELEELDINYEAI